MKKLWFTKAILIMFVYVNIGKASEAQNFKLIDVDKIKSSNPRNDEYSAKNAFTFFNGYFYFSADDGIHGSELWRTDGTASGTKLVKDVNPGTASSDKFGNYDLTVSGGKMYFVADDSAHEWGLWVSDGTNDGTSLVIDIGPDAYYLDIQYLTDVNGTLFFVVSYYDNNFNGINQIWKTDGTTSGTILVSDYTNAGFYLQQLTTVNGKLFFTFYSFITSTYNLYTSDGTTEGTNVVASFASFPTHLTASNGLLYFAADADGTGGKLWISDGTPAGTLPVSNTNNINLPTDYGGVNNPFAIINDVLYFQGITTDAGNELCKYDPSDPVPNVTIVKDIIPGTNSSYPSFMTNVNGTLFFTIEPVGADAELWKSDGTSDGTVLVKDINPGGENFYNNLISVNGDLFFTYGNDALGTELWKSDGSSFGTVLVRDIFAGSSGSFPAYLTSENGLVLFSATDGKNGVELWESNGTETGTTMLKNINQTSTESSSPYGFAATNNNKVLFSAFDGSNYGLFSTDGSDAGTKQISISGYSYPVNFKNKTYFIGDSNRLWKTNGTKGGTSVLPIPGFADYSNGYVVAMTATETSIYILTFDFTTNMQTLWRTDGTSGGTYIIKSDLGNFGLYSAVIGNTLFFSSYANANGELWKSDGTVEGTTLVKQITAPFTYTPVFNLTNYNGKLYFVASNTYSSPDFIYTFWTSDGTEAGTKIVKPVSIFVDFSTNTLFAQGNSKLFFYALNPITKGYELFASDGTAKGTRLVKDINKGPASSSINSIISGDTLVYFMADDGKHGSELWKSNGTKEGTSLVKNITAGINGTAISQMVNIHDKLFFVANDVLWQSDGMKENTYPVKDANLDGVTQINGLTAIGGSLYFSGYTYAAGTELYTANVANTLAPIEMVNSNSIISKQNENEFEARLLTNPVTDQLKFTINIKDRQAAQVIIVDASGRVLKSEKQTLSAGANIISYDTQGWAQGIYIIHILTEDGSSLLKAVK